MNQFQTVFCLTDGFTKIAITADSAQKVFDVGQGFLFHFTASNGFFHSDFQDILYLILDLPPEAIIVSTNANDIINAEGDGEFLILVGGRGGHFS